ncbi:MAG: cupin domain-containing protein [Betaproteobacteria bacterium]
MLRELPSRLTATTLFPRRSSRLLECWRAGTWLVEHGDVGRLRSIASIPELRDLDQVLALEPPKLSAYGLSSTAPALRHGRESVPTLQSIDHLTPSQARSAYDIGLSILCGDLLPLVPALETQIEGLLREFGLPALGSGASRLLDISGVEPLEAVMSFSPAGAEAALGIHYDAFDVISIQLQGTKVWMLGANQDVEFPLSSYETETPGSRPIAETINDSGTPKLARSRRRSAGAPTLERVKMRPGSVLFVARGAWHCTREVGKSEPSVTLLLKFSPPSYVEVLVTALFTQLSQRAQWRAPCVGLFRPDDKRTDVMKAFQDLVSGLQLDADELLLKHFMPDRAGRDLLAFEKTEGSTLRVGRAAPRATAIGLRLKTPTHTVELVVDADLAPLCMWLADSRRQVVTYNDACARAADETSVWNLLVALEDAGVIAVAIASSAAPRFHRRATKR